MGLAGAIPADLAREVAEAIIRDGRVKRGWIGLEVQPLLQSSDAKRGALVGGTIEGSPAAAAGFRVRATSCCRSPAATSPSGSPRNSRRSTS